MAVLWFVDISLPSCHRFRALSLSEFYPNRASTKNKRMSMAGSVKLHAPLSINQCQLQWHDSNDMLQEDRAAKCQLQETVI